MMHDLFSFMAVRPVKAAHATRLVRISGQTLFQGMAADAVNSLEDNSERWDTLTKVAREYICPDEDWPNYTPYIVTQTDSLPLTAKFHALRRRFENITFGNYYEDSLLEHLQNHVRLVFNGMSAFQLQADETYLTDRDRIWDNIILIYLLPELQHNPFGMLCEFAQMINMIDQLADPESRLTTHYAVTAALSATVLLPEALLQSDPAQTSKIAIGELLVVRYEPRDSETGEPTDAERELIREVEDVVACEMQPGAISQDFGHVLRIGPNPGGYFSHSRSDWQDLAAVHAKGIVSRALKNVKMNVARDDTPRVNEKISGVVQVFSYGRRVVLDSLMADTSCVTDSSLDWDQITCVRRRRHGPARVVVPTIYGMEPLLTYHMMASAEWAGADLPRAADFAGVSVAEEMRHQHDGDEAACGHSWGVWMPPRSHPGAFREDVIAPTNAEDWRWSPEPTAYSSDGASEWSHVASSHL